MEAAIIHFGDPWEVVAATSLNAGIRRVFGDCRLSWIVSPECYSLLQYNDDLANVSTSIDMLALMPGPFDFIINLSPQREIAKTLSIVKTAARFGFIYDDIKGDMVFADRYAQSLYRVIHNNECLDQTIPQLIFRTCGITWRGEGYDLRYYPKSRTKKGKTGIAIKDDSLRRFIKQNLKLDLTQMWHIPMRQDLRKRMDEMNRCKLIVTDDLFVAHAGVAMKKEIQFLDTNNLQMKIEFFGRGEHLRISRDEL